MKESFGGILNLVLIVVFLLVVMGSLGLVVSYTKAFRMKNNVISRLEQYEGTSCFDANPGKTMCYERILQDAEKLGYSPTVQLSCPNGFKNAGDYFCYAEREGSYKDFKYKNYNYDGSSSQASASCKTRYFDVITQVDINIPIINKIMGMSFFQINGSTRTIVTSTCH